MKLLFLVVFVASFFVSATAQTNDWQRSRGTIPANAVEAGYEDNGRATYICRAGYRGGFIGGKALDDRCYYNPGNGEVSVRRFDILVGNGYSWRRTSSRSKAVAAGGNTEENYYVCRVTDGKGLYPGRTSGSRCYYTRNNRGKSSSRFEVLESRRRGANLLSAASSGDFRRVQDALRDGQAVDQRDNNGRTALMLAASGGYDNIIRELINERADLEARDEKGNTALILAAEKGRQNVVELLFRAGANHRIRNDAGENAFVASATGGHLDTMSVFLEDNRYGGVERVDQEIALNRAAFFGRNAVVRFLIARGLNPNSRDMSDRTPLIQAALGGNASTVEYLLGQDVLINARDDSGKTAFESAAMKDSVKVLRVFVDRELITREDEQAGAGLRIAAGNNKKNALKYLLELRVDPDFAEPESGDTATIIAARLGRSNVVEILLKSGAGVDVQNRIGRTALMEAAANSKRNALKVIIKAGAFIDLRDNEGVTALGLAIRNGHSDTRKELQKAGARQ